MLVSLTGMAFLTATLFVLIKQKDGLQAKLATQTYLTEQYLTLATSRRSQLDELHALIAAHNMRLGADEEWLENYQHKLGELEDYLSKQMADNNTICLDNGDVERLRQIWQSPSHPNSN